MISIPALRESLHRWITRINRAYYTRGFRREFNPDGVDVFEADWDNYLLLDACRYDSLADRELPGTLHRRQSHGSMTVEFLHANVVGRDLTDTVYVTATPQLQQVADESSVHFHHVENIWEDEDNFWKAPDGRFCILPETTTEFAKQAAAKFPNKRLFVHYTQPHLPFIDPPDDALARDGNIYRMYIRGELSSTRQDIRDAYEANLDRTIPHVRSLLDSIEGRTVVSSDHGEFLGERGFPIPIRMWAHPHGIYQSPVVDVPWLVHESGLRREIVSEPPRDTSSEVDFDTVRDRLEHLGYRTD